MNTSRRTLVGAISAAVLISALFVAAIAAPPVASASCVHPSAAAPTDGTRPNAHPNECGDQGAACDSVSDCCGSYDCQGGSCCITSGNTCGSGGFGCGLFSGHGAPL